MSYTKDKDFQAFCKKCEHHRMLTVNNKFVRQDILYTLPDTPMYAMRTVEHICRCADPLQNDIWVDYDWDKVMQYDLQLPEIVEIECPMYLEFLVTQNEA